MFAEIHHITLALHDGCSVFLQETGYSSLKEDYELTVVVLEVRGT
jgi:hypothetical protein